MSYLKKLFLFCLLAVTPQLFAANLDELDKYIEDMRVKYKAPGVSISIVEGDKIIYAKGFGVNQIDKPEKVDPNTAFQLASVSKTFTSAGLGIWVDKKLLNWDDPVIQYLPQFVLKDIYATRYSTSRDLLAHRTGLPAFTGDLLTHLGYNREEILSKIKYIEPANSFRNVAYYSNVGFFAAGEVLAKLSNMSYEEAIKNTLLVPMKMARTGFASEMNIPNVAAPHVLKDDKVQVSLRDPSRIFAAAGGLYSSAHDMANWMILHLNKGVFEGKQILTPETIEEMHKPSMVSEVGFTELPPINEWSSFSFGLGWDNYNYKGKFIVEKAGALDGVRSVVTLIPDLKIGVTVLTNLNLTILPEVIRAKILEIYLGKSDQDFTKEFDAKAKMIADLIKSEPKQKDALPFNRDLSQCVGVYVNELYGDFEVVQKGENLALLAGPAKWKGSLNHVGNDSFNLRWPLVNAGNELVTFVFGVDGKAIEIQTESLGVFKRKP